MMKFFCIISFSGCTVHGKWRVTVWRPGAKWRPPASLRRKLWGCHYSGMLQQLCCGLFRCWFTATKRHEQNFDWHIGKDDKCVLVGWVRWILFSFFVLYVSIFSDSIFADILKHESKQDRLMCCFSSDKPCYSNSGSVKEPCSKQPNKKNQLVWYMR